MAQNWLKCTPHWCSADLLRLFSICPYPYWYIVSNLCDVMTLFIDIAINECLMQFLSHLMSPLHTFIHSSDWTPQTVPRCSRNNNQDTGLTFRLYEMDELKNRSKVLLLWKKLTAGIESPWILESGVSFWDLREKFLKVLFKKVALTRRPRNIKI